MSKCHCCGYSLLKYTNGSHVYWFCSHCWQEMPNIEQIRIVNYRKSLERKIEKSPWTLEEKMPSLSKTQVNV